MMASFQSDNLSTRRNWQSGSRPLALVACFYYVTTYRLSNYHPAILPHLFEPYPENESSLLQETLFHRYEWTQAFYCKEGLWS